MCWYRTSIDDAVDAYATAGVTHGAAADGGHRKCEVVPGAGDEDVGCLDGSTATRRRDILTVTTGVGSTAAQVDLFNAFTVDRCRACLRQLVQVDTLLRRRVTGVYVDVCGCRVVLVWSTNTDVLMLVV